MLSAAIDSRIRRRLFAGLLSVVVVSSVGYVPPFYTAGCAVGEMMLFALFVVMLAMSGARPAAGRARELDVRSLVFLGMGVLGGVVTKMATGTPSMTPVINACVAPLMVFWCAQWLVRAPGDAWRVLAAALAGLVLFVALWAGLFYTGRASFAGNYGNMSVIALDITLGARAYTLWGNWTAAIGALGVFLSLVFLARARRGWLVMACGAAALAFAVVGMKAGAKTGPAGIALAVLLFLWVVAAGGRSGRALLRIAGLAGACVILFFTFEGQLDNVLNMDLNRSRMESFFDRQSDDRSVAHRLGLVQTAVEDVTTHVAGRGFGVLWQEGQVDESCFYTWWISGTGLLGAVGLFGIVGSLLLRFCRRLRCPDREVRGLALVGFCIMVLILFSALGSDQMLGMPETALKFWAVMAAAGKIMLLPARGGHGPVQAG